MRIWHMVVGVIVFTAIVMSFTNYGSGGLLYDMKYLPNGSTSYNSAINESYFSKYNYETQVEQDVTADLRENTTGGRYDTDLDTEQSALARLWDGAQTAGKGVYSSSSVIETVSAEFGAADVIKWAAITILSLFVIFKTTEFIFGR